MTSAARVADAVPREMRALVLHQYGGIEAVRLETRPVPRPGPGQVLIRVLASPLDPSDLLFVRGLYAYRKKLPVVLGSQGCGQVVARGSGLLSRILGGKRVACTAPPDGDGPWAEYMVVSAKQCVPVGDELSDEQGSLSLVNPMTAWALLDQAKRRKSPAVVQTAAASSLGQMLHRLSRRFRVEVINVVRRPEQVSLLQSQGARHVLDSTEDGFDERLREACHRLDARLAFDAVGGDLTTRLLAALPRESAVLLMGWLSRSDCALDPRRLIYDDKRVEGFFVPNWLGKKRIVEVVFLGRSVSKLVAAELGSEIRRRVGLEEAVAALADYDRAMTGGKIVLVPGRRDGARGQSSR